MNNTSYPMWVLAGYRGTTGMLEELAAEDIEVSEGMAQELDGYIERMTAVRDQWRKKIDPTWDSGRLAAAKRRGSK